MIYRNYLAAPPDRYYWGNDDFPLDQQGNLSYVRSGYNGHWQVFVKLTSTLPDQKSFLKIEYLIMGHLARVLQLDPLHVFYLARFGISVVYIWLIYFLAGKIFEQRYARNIGFILSIFAASISIPSKENVFAYIAVPDVLVFQRLTTSAHHYMLGGISTLISLYFLAKVLDQPSNKVAFLCSVIFGFIMSMTYAPNTVIVFTSIPMVLLIKFLYEFICYRKVNAWRTWIPILFSYVLVVMLPLIYLPLMRLTQWKGTAISSNLENINPFSVTILQYVLGLGASYILAWFAVPRIVRRQHTLLLFFVSWLIIHPIGEYFISDIIGINRIRYFLSPYFVVFGLVATEGVLSIGNVFARVSKRLKMLSMIVVVITAIFLSYYSYVQSVIKLRTCYCVIQFFDYGYPKKELMQAIWWLRDNTTEDDVVLSDTFAGNIIPAFAGNRVYTSWWYRLTGSSHFVYIMDFARWFYMKRFTPADVRWFVDEYGIDYVLQGEYERGFGDGSDLEYSDLEPVARFGQTVIYKVKR